MQSPKDIHFEPYKIKTVEPLAMPNPLDRKSRSIREKALVKANYNLFFIPAETVTIDLLTDSGTGAMSQEQWAAMMVGDESYAQAVSFKRLEKAIQEVTSADFKVIPTHQGRAAENVMFFVLNQLAARAHRDGQPLRRRVLINSFFDTTAANVMLNGPLTAEDIRKAGKGWGKLSDDSRDRKEAELKLHLLIEQNQFVVDQSKPELFEHGVFGGNVNLDSLEAVLKDPAQRAEVMLVMMTVTNNTGGGLPVSMANLKAVRAMIDRYSANDPEWIPGLRPLMLFLDACRFAENCYYIQQYEPGYKGKTVADIAHEMFALVDGATMSAKKDGMVNIGGWLICRSGDLQQRFWEHMVEIEGFFTYGGLAGRDLEALAVGMHEGVDDARVAQRVQQVQKLWNLLDKAGVPVKQPCGGHGVFLMGRKFWQADGKELIQPEYLAGHTLAVELYRQYGIRACEIGTIMFGGWDPATGKATNPSTDDYVRLAVPRRVYTDTHMEYVAASIAELYHNRLKNPPKGLRFTYRPAALPHFLSHFEPVK